MNRFAHNVVLGLVMSMAVSLPCQALHWDKGVVYDGGIGCGDCTLISSAGSTPQVVYGAAGTLRVATQGTDTPWPWTTGPSCGASGGFSSATFDGGGHLGISFVYSDWSADTAEYTTNASGSWVTEAVSTLGGWGTDFTGLDYDSANTPWVAFCDGEFLPSIKVAKRTGASQWPVQATFSDIGESTGPALVISPDNTVSVSFVDAKVARMKVARRPATGIWTTEILDGSASSPAQSSASLSTDQSGRPVVAYFVGPLVGNMWLKYGVRTALGWQTESVVQMPSSGSCQCSVAVAPDGAPWIAYTDSNDSSLAVARKVNGVWVHEAVDSSVSAGRPSIKVDSNGNAYIAYVDQWAGTVLFASGTSVCSLEEVKRLPDGVPVRCEGLVSTTRNSTNGEDFTDRHYVQASNRSMGIMVYYGGTTDPLERDIYVTVTGTTGHVNGERAIIMPSISPGQSAGAIRPLGMNNQTLGGGPFAYSPGPPICGQQGIDGARGVSNIGLLVRIWGRVGEVDPNTPKTWFKIDNGSADSVKCMLPSGASAPSGIVAVTGISSCEDIGSGKLGRVLRIRASDWP